jgi:hypothetical protein
VGAKRATARPENVAPTRPTNGAGGETRTPNLLFLCGSYRTALVGWHHLASGLARPRMDTNRLRSSSDRQARKCGGKCGVSGSDRYVSVMFMDAMTASVSAQAGLPVAPVTQSQPRTEKYALVRPRPS